MRPPLSLHANQGDVLTAELEVDVCFVSELDSSEKTTTSTSLTDGPSIDATTPDATQTNDVTMKKSYKTLMGIQTTSTTLFHRVMVKKKVGTTFVANKSGLLFRVLCL